MRSLQATASTPRSGRRQPVRSRRVDTRRPVKSIGDAPGRVCPPCCSCLAEHPLSRTVTVARSRCWHIELCCTHTQSKGGRHDISAPYPFTRHCGCLPRHPRALDHQRCAQCDGHGVRPSHEQLVALIGHEVSADVCSWLQHHSQVLIGLARDAARRRLNAQPRPRPIVRHTPIGNASHSAPLSTTLVATGPRSGNAKRARREPHFNDRCTRLVGQLWEEMLQAGVLSDLASCYQQLGKDDGHTLKAPVTKWQERGVKTRLGALQTEGTREVTIFKGTPPQPP